MHNNSLYFLFISLLFIACQRQEVDSTLAPLPNTTTVSATKQLSFINERIDDDSYGAEYYYHRAKLHSASNELRAAMKDIQAAISLDSSQGHYHFWKAQILNLLNTPRDAINSALKAEQLGYSGVDLDLLLGKLHYLNQNPVQALIHLRRARQINQESAAISYYFGAIYADASDTAQAFNELNEALTLDSTNLNAYTKYIQLTNKVEMVGRSFKLAQQAVKYCKPDEDLSFEIAQLLLTANQVDSAAFWFQKILTQAPSSWKANLGMAKYLIAKKQYVEAENYYVTALEYNPNIEGGYYQLGYIYEYYAKDLNKALKYYKKATRLNRGDVEIAAAARRAEWKVANKGRIPTRTSVTDSTSNSESGSSE